MRSVVSNLAQNTGPGLKLYKQASEKPKEKALPSVGGRTICFGIKMDVNQHCTHLSSSKFPDGLTHLR